MAFRRWRQRETVNRHVLVAELEGHYIIGIPRGSGVGSKLADFCNTASVGPRQYVLVRGSSEGWCRRSEPSSSSVHLLLVCTYSRGQGLANDRGQYFGLELAGSAKEVSH